MDATGSPARRSLLSPAERTFLAEARRAVLATIRPDGRPRLVPICFVVSPSADAAGRAVLYSPLDDKPKSVADPRRLARARDLAARPDVVVLVERWSEDWDRLAWLRLDGRGELVEPGEPGETAAAERTQAIAALRARYPQYAGHRLEDRPLLRLTIERTQRWGDLRDGGRPSE